MATKRKNPFVEEVPRQLKVYVGPKQVAGVEEMKLVHDHTKYLLFKGSNPSASTEVLHSLGCTSNRVSNGTVAVHPITSVKENIAPPTCHQCGKTVTLSAMIKCQDCERVACAYCNRYCIVCAGKYCCYCSVLNYDQPDVRTICLNCLPMVDKC